MEKDIEVIKSLIEEFCNKYKCVVEIYTSCNARKLSGEFVGLQAKFKISN
jgi:hypothetical protein